MAAGTHYEFGGPWGVFAITFGLPTLLYVFAFACNDISGCPAPSLLSPSTLTLDKLKQEVGWHGISSLINAEAILATAGYHLWCLILHAALPAKIVEGTELRCGGKLKYRVNVFSSAIFTLSILAAGTIAKGPDFPVWPFIWRNFIPLFTCNLVISFALATFTYVRSFSVKPGNPDLRELAAGGHTGNMLYDWFIGRELNPRITLPLLGEIDIKSFCELRPGLIGYLIIDLAFMVKQYQTYGSVSTSMLLVVLAQGFYVLDGLYMEPAVFTTMDIVTDGFGFMLSFGDLCWVPFLYTTQARYLATHPVHLRPVHVACVVACFLLGQYIFRSTNNEKDRFRKNPQDPRVRHLRYMTTRTGSKLLVSGWWGRARHINYLGDWIMAWAYCLPTGVAGYVINRSSVADGGEVVEVVQGLARGWGIVFTYFYIVYFGVLLVHREMRDEEKCRRKYGADWERYCELVPYRLIPGVF